MFNSARDNPKFTLGKSGRKPAITSKQLIALTTSINNHALKKLNSLTPSHLYKVKQQLNINDAGLDDPTVVVSAKQLSRSTVYKYKKILGLVK